MPTMYVVVKHENLIETDDVTVVCVAKDKHTANLQLLMETEPLYGQYILLEERESYKRFTDEQGEIMVEVYFEEVQLINW